jgi:hypothetical protein
MPTSIPKSAHIYVAGHRGLVGSAILRALWLRVPTSVVLISEALVSVLRRLSSVIWSYVPDQTAQKLTDRKISI